MINKDDMIARLTDSMETYYDRVHALEADNAQLTTENKKIRAALLQLLSSVDAVLSELKPGQALSPAGAGRTNALIADRNSARIVIKYHPSIKPKLAAALEVPASNLLAEDL